MCVLLTTVSSTTADEPIEVLFELCTQMGPMNRVLGKDPDLYRKNNFEGVVGISRRLVKYREYEARAKVIR